MFDIWKLNNRSYFGKKIQVSLKDGSVKEGILDDVEEKFDNDVSDGLVLIDKNNPDGYLISENDIISTEFL